uniref:F-box domain-containing protein n=1 Tax=Caenorhabditis tropicalis TaxID=1561998 RepID=A0A1I7UE95_9PELO
MLRTFRCFVCRHSLRHTSRLDRQIVDSTKCQVPRVRFGYKEGRGLIVVYTGIDQFLRIEMEDTEKGILITKFENSFDPEKARPPFIMKKEPEKPCLIILLQMTYFFLIINPKIHIKVLEMEIPELAANDPVKELLDGVAQTTVALGQVDELVFCGLGNHTISSNVMALAKDCKKSFIQLMITHDNIGLTRAYDNLFVRKNGSFTDTFLIVSTERHEPGSPNLDLSYNQQCKEQLKDKDKSVLICSLRNLNDRNPKECSRKTNGELVQWSKTTECGQVKRTIRKIHEEDCKQQLESTECGIGDLCKRCSDPFDYWYTQNLPRRLYFEPFWDGFVYIPHNFSEQSRCHIQNLKSKIAQYEKEKQRIRKIVEKKKGKNQVASWGFGKEHRGWEEYVMKSVIKDFKEKEILDEIGIEKWPTASSLEADLEKLSSLPKSVHSLRHTSRLDRQIVDSTKCQVPRVRFGYKEGRGLIVVYTGIDQFLRIEMEEKEEGILITKFENSFDPETARPPFLIKHDPEQLPLVTLMQMVHFFFLVNPKIHIRVLEIEIPELAAGNMVGKYLVRDHLEATILTTVSSGLVNEIVFCGFADWTLFEHVMAAAKNRCKTTVIETIISDQNMRPVVANDSLRKDVHGLLNHTLFSTENDDPDRLFIGCFYERRCQDQLDDEEAGFLVCSLRNLNDRALNAALATCANDAPIHSTTEISSWGFGKEQRGWEPYVVYSVMRDYSEKIVLKEMGFEKWPILPSSDSDREKIGEYYKKHPEKISFLVHEKPVKTRKVISKQVKPLETLKEEEEGPKIENTVPMETEQPQILAVEEAKVAVEVKDTDSADCRNCEQCVDRRLKFLAMVFFFPIILCFVFSFFFELKW